jgi:HSP20 family protein
MAPYDGRKRLYSLAIRSLGARRVRLGTPVANTCGTKALPSTTPEGATAMNACYNVYPRSDFGVLQREVDRMFGHAADAVRPVIGHNRIGEDENNHYIELDAPGLKTESLDVTVKENVLSIHAMYDTPAEETQIKWRNGAPRTGEYAQRFRLPDAVSSEGIQAEYRHGVLRITVPKSEATKPRQIAVEVR